MDEGRVYVVPRGSLVDVGEWRGCRREVGLGIGFPIQADREERLEEG